LFNQIKIIFSWQAKEDYFCKQATSWDPIYFMKNYLLILFLLLSISSAAQIKISGTITDKRGQPIPGANIGIVNSYDGGSSNSEGQYSFSCSEKGQQKIKVSMIGFVKQEFTLDIGTSNITKNISLKEKISKLKAVRITAGAFEASDEKQGTSLSSLDMVTTAGSDGDVIGALKTLPGTQQTNDREGLFVRGGLGSETQTFIDGTRVRNAFNTGIPDLGSRGRFSPFIFKGTIFSAGGYSALYGQALSSALILSTIDLPEKSSANLSLSSVGLGGGYQHLTKNKQSSYGLNYNFTNLGPYFKVIPQNIEFIRAPLAHQIDANYRRRTSKTGMIKFYGYWNNTQNIIRRDNVTSLDYDLESKRYKDEFGLTNNNVYANLSYQEFLNTKWKLNVGANISNNTDDVRTRILTQDDELVSDINFLQERERNILGENFFTTAKLVLQHYLPKENTIRFGTEYVYQNDEQAVSIPNLVNTRYQEQDHYKALFTEADIYLTNSLACKIGLRAEHSQRLGKLNLAPRISAAYKVSKGGQFSAAYGIFYQNPSFNALSQNTLTNQFYTPNIALDFQRADHYILNYLYQKKGRLLRLEAYNKEYKNLIKTGLPNSGPLSSGSGYARGLELFYRDKTTLKGIDYWLSYSYIDSKRDFLNYPTAVQPSFVANHVASLVFKKFWSKKMFGINGTYTYSSGRPYNNPNENEFMMGRTIDYHTLGLSLNYIRTIGKKIFSVFVLSINNPLNFKQVYGYNYAQQDLNGDGLLSRKEITPPARQFIFLGTFMSWGIDRSQEAINNNL